MLHEQDQREAAILTFLAGAFVDDVARDYAIDVSELVASAEMYRIAGIRALTTRTASRWHYWRVPISMPGANGNGASDLEDDLLVTAIGPLCSRLISSQQISHWWFMRKADGGVPHLRLRIFGDEPELSQKVLPQFEELFARLEQERRIQPCTTLVYEPETMVFGGPVGLEAAHTLFSKDSEMLTQWLTLAESANDLPGLKHRPEASLLIIQQLMRGAGLDIFEQWDVWGQMTRLRIWPTTSAKRTKNSAALAKLFWGPPDNHQTLFGEKLYPLIARWGESFETCGRELAQVHREGQLERGLRQVIASLIIFHWNRLGFSAAMQSELTRLAEMSYAQLLNQPAPRSTQIETTEPSLKR